MSVAIRNTWEHFAHGADIGVRGIGPTKEAAFEQIAAALTSVITDLKSVRPERAVPISCEAPSDDLLLVDWLNALIYEMATRRMLFSAFVVTIESRACMRPLGGNLWTAFGMSQRLRSRVQFTRRFASSDSTTVTGSSSVSWMSEQG